MILNPYDKHKFFKYINKNTEGFFLLIKRFRDQIYEEKLRVKLIVSRYEYLFTIKYITMFQKGGVSYPTKLPPAIMILL